MMVMKGLMFVWNLLEATCDVLLCTVFLFLVLVFGGKVSTQIVYCHIYTEYILCNYNQSIFPLLALLLLSSQTESGSEQTQSNNIIFAGRRKSWNLTRIKLRKERILPPGIFIKWKTVKKDVPSLIYQPRLQAHKLILLMNRRFVVVKSTNHNIFLLTSMK